MKPPLKSIGVGFRNYYQRWRTECVKGTLLLKTNSQEGSSHLVLIISTIWCGSRLPGNSFVQQSCSFCLTQEMLNGSSLPFWALGLRWCFSSPLGLWCRLIFPSMVRCVSCPVRSGEFQSSFGLANLVWDTTPRLSSCAWHECRVGSWGCLTTPQEHV